MRLCESPTRAPILTTNSSQNPDALPGYVSTYTSCSRSGPESQCLAAAISPCKWSVPPRAVWMLQSNSLLECRIKDSMEACRYRIKDSNNILQFKNIEDLECRWFAHLETGHRDCSYCNGLRILRCRCLEVCLGSPTLPNTALDFPNFNQQSIRLINWTTWNWRQWGEEKIVDCKVCLTICLASPMQRNTFPLKPSQS